MTSRERKLEHMRKRREQNRQRRRCLNEYSRPHEPPWAHYTRCADCIEVYERSRKS